MKANDYVPQTAYEVYHNYPDKKVVGLYYVDDDGNKVTPHNLYFSSNMRKCNNDETQVHGRAFTCAMGKHGTHFIPCTYPMANVIVMRTYAAFRHVTKKTSLKTIITDRRTKLWHV